MLPSGTLELMLVRLEDEGAYTCTASNAAGNVSRTVELKVQSESRRGEREVKGVLDWKREEERGNIGIVLT